MNSAPLPVLERRPHGASREDPSEPRLAEVMLYFGNACNRACTFCCVDGRPGGSYIPFDSADVDAIVAHIRPDARIKLYGGEPTLYAEDLIGVVAALRAGGYAGRLTVFSNGIQSTRLIRMLEADPPTDRHPGSDAYLNHAIWHGQGAEPIPASRKRELLEWARVNPGRLWLGHQDVLPVGGAEQGCAEGPLADAPNFGGRCARCHPTFRSDGSVHACAFAAETRAPVYELGRIDDPVEAITAKRRRFLDWIDRTVEPEAERRGVPACRVCLEYARESVLRR